ELLVDAQRQNGGHANGHEEVEEDPDLNEQRKSEGRDQSGEKDPVLERYQADELRDRLPPRCHEQKTAEDQRERDRQRLSGRERAGQLEATGREIGDQREPDRHDESV